MTARIIASVAILIPIIAESMERLGKINVDFYNAYHHTASQDNLPRISFHPFSTGPFDRGQTKHKHSYIDTGFEGIKYDNLS